MRKKTFALFALGLSLVACRGGDDGDPGTTDAPPTVDAPPTELRIQDVQSEAMAKGTAVALKGVIVTAIDSFGSKTGDFYIQDPEGGAFSGVKVYGAPLDQVAALLPGDIIDISGAVKDEFMITNDTLSITEIKPASSGSMVLTKTGTGAVPAPAVVDAAAISLLDAAAQKTEWEKWEGVLISVTNARQVGTESTFSSGAVDQHKFPISAGLNVESVLTEIYADNAFGICYDRVTGIGDYAFGYLVLPRSTDDIVTGGAGCRAMPTSVVDIQMGSNVEVAKLTNVVVTARYDKGFWIADALQAAPYGGVLVYTGSTVPPATYVAGAIVNVQGAVTEFDLGTPPVGDTLTEMQFTEHSLVSAAVDAPLPVTVTAEVAGDIGAAGEPYEGVLVQLSTVKVTSTDAGAGKVELTDNAGKKILMDNDIFNWTAPAMSTCYSTLTGIMNVQVNDNVRTINPRSDADMVTGTGCN